MDTTTETKEVLMMTNAEADVLAFAVRYALDRPTTTAPHTVAPEVVRQWNRLQGWQQKQLLGEVQAANPGRTWDAVLALQVGQYSHSMTIEDELYLSQAAVAELTEESRLARTALTTAEAEKLTPEELQVLTLCVNWAYSDRIGSPSLPHQRALNALSKLRASLPASACPTNCTTCKKEQTNG